MNKKSIYDKFIWLGEQANMSKSEVDEYYKKCFDINRYLVSIGVSQQKCIYDNKENKMIYYIIVPKHTSITKDSGEISDLDGIDIARIFKSNMIHLYKEYYHIDHTEYNGNIVVKYKIEDVNFDDELSEKFLLEFDKNFKKYD